MAIHLGKRYNDGKSRLGLISTFAREVLGRILTFGANKYEDRNWEKGMDWQKCIDSLERHLNAFKAGEDFDPESGELHIGHVMCNAMFLTEYYRTYPQGDSRPLPYLRTPRIGLDVDEVICDFVGGWQDLYGIKEPPETWNFDRNIKEKFNKLKASKDFWLNLKPKVNPREIPFEPACYITSRHVPTEWTEQWIDKNGFPTMPVHTVGLNQSKVEVAKKHCDWFVDDRYENFVELNRAGICTFLMDAPHNQRYEVGYKRISKLADLLSIGIK